VAELADDADEAAWLDRLEAWYTSGAALDVSSPVRLLGEAGLRNPEFAAAVEAKQQFDVALYSVRRALGAGSTSGLGEVLARVFESAEGLWTARARLEWLARFASWLAELEPAERYLRDVEPVDDRELDELKRTLLEWLERPEAFVDERRRGAFDDAFAALRDEYGRAYGEQHDWSVGPAVIDRLADALIESGPWRTLEALSSLPIGNPSYLIEATNLISLLRESQCASDVRASLDERPRCACGFKLGDRLRIASLATSASEFIQTGIQYHRRLVQARRSELRAKLKARKSSYDLETIKLIAELTGDGEMPELTPAAVEALEALLTARS
jgi:hypothetical protein